MNTLPLSMIILIVICPSSFGLSCTDILETPADKKITLSELQSIPPKELVQCLAHLGKEQLGINEADYIWRSIVTYYGSSSKVPDQVLMLLHWITPALTPEDYSNITFNGIDVIQNFGLNYNLNRDQLSAIADRVREDFAGKEPEDYTYYDLTALRQILCAFNRSEIERIHPAAYKEAALIIGKLQDCSTGVMMGFATLAIQKTAFGPPNTWSEATKKILGVVAEFLPSALRNDNNAN